MVASLNNEIGDMSLGVLLFVAKLEARNIIGRLFDEL
jgi:hypothetical protein